MLHRRDENGLIVIGQPAHAWVSGQLARAWGNDRFGAFEPWEEVCLAAEQHDIGVAALDAQPDLNADTGPPYSFAEIPRPQHVALWAAAAGMVLPQSRYAALSVSVHGTGLYEHYDSPEDADLVREYLARDQTFQEALLGSLRADERYARYSTPDVVARNRRLVSRFDGISLALCHALRHEHVHEGVPTADGETTLTVTPVDGDASEYVIDPWPFNEEEVTVVYDGRRLEGVFTDQEAMRTALRGAPWVTLTTHLRPAEARLTDARARLRARPRRQASLAAIRAPEVDTGLAEDVLE